MKTIIENYYYYYYYYSMKYQKKKYLLSFVIKFQDKIPDSSNAKQCYQIFLKNKNKISAK